MPKSRFNPKSHSGNKNRNRHDPLSRRSNTSNSTSTSTTAITTTTTTSDINQLIPVLSKLPLPDSNKPNTTSEADLLWALSSISVLLENRNSRKSLLNPSNKLSSRLINAFKSSLTLTPSSSSNLQLRREASGALRNLCIEATRTNDKLLEVVVSEKGIQLVLDQLVWVSKQLGILEKDSNDKASEEKEDLDSLLQANLINSQKPLDQLNRKEKRQLAKLNKALEKQQEKSSSSIKEDSKMEISEDKESTSNGNGVVKSQQDQDQDSLDEKISLNFIAENCITILWCLIESTSTSGNDASMSSQTLINLNERSTILSFILSGFLKNGFQILQDQPISIERNENGNSSIIRRKEQLRESHLNLTIQSLNALNSISENNLIFSVGFLGLSENLLIELEEENESNSKKKGKKKSSKHKFVFVNPPDQKQGKEILNRLIETINFSIQSEGKADGNDSVSEVEVSHYSQIFSIISCSILRNLITSLPKKVSNDISVSSSSSSSNPSQTSLVKFERNQVLPYLLKLIEKKSSSPDLDFPGSHLIQVIQEVEASTKNIKDQPTTTTNSDLKSTDPEKIVEGLNKSRVNGHSNANGEVKKVNDNEEEEEDDNNNNLDSESPLVIALKKNQSQLESKLLLMEVLAELVGTLPGGSDEDEEDDKEEEWKEEEDGDGILDGDEEMDQDRSGDEDQEMEMEMESGLSKSETKDQDMMITADESINKSSTTKSSSIQNQLSKSPLINLLTNQDFLVRISTIIQSLSSNLNLSFPSIQTQSESKDLDLNLHYQSSKSLRQILFRLTSIQSNFLMNFSNFFSPPPPSTPLEPESKQESIVEFFKQWSSSQVQFEIFVNVWKESFGLASKLASLECLNNPLLENQEETKELSNNNKVKEFKDQSTSSRLLIENCISNLWSLSRLFQGSNLPLSLSSSTPNSNEIPLALISAYQTSIEDSMRVKCLSTLGCLARSEKVSIELNHQIGTFFIEILSNLKDANNNIPTTNKDSSFTTAESMVAVLDSLFDIYADENSSYDVQVFRKNDFKGKLRSVWGKVRAEARRIDRRRFPSLREKADEAAQNLMDFIKYRDSLGF